MTRKPVLFELDGDEPMPSVAEAPPPPDAQAQSGPMGRLAARRSSPWARLVLGALSALVLFLLSVWAWDTVTGLLARNRTLGLVALWLVGAALLGLALLTLSEALGFLRLRRIDRLRAEVSAASLTGDVDRLRPALDAVAALYRGRPEMRWHLARYRERAPEIVDGPGLLALAEAELMAPLDRAAEAAVERAARNVAGATALIPLPLADLAVAVHQNLSMIRAVAEIYGGRAGLLGSRRLARAVVANMLATGIVSAGDDLLGSVAGGGVLSRLSRRFGEGVINGALTARVGVAAMDVARPVPFDRGGRPRVSVLTRRALRGMFPGADGGKGAPGQGG
ncbi:MAG: DUF697 domain-containing protein [Alphaproteobacteria bacterium]|nr:MAG: DUF697 domain-containing protein [Alphaproteobacteria bacterium]